MCTYTLLRMLASTLPFSLDCMSQSSSSPRKKRGKRERKERKQKKILFSISLIDLLFFVGMHPSRLRCAVHAFVRAPHFASIPSTAPNGTVVNRDLLQGQFRDLYKTLQRSQLVDQVHLLSERPGGMEALRVADVLFSVGANHIATPLSGNEHRATEFMETMRYVRHAGGPTSLQGVLQDHEGCRLHSGDVVSLPGGIAVGHGPRTNTAAHQHLRAFLQLSYGGGTHSGLLGDVMVLTLEQESDAPPLGDYFGFAGDNVLLAWKDEHGLLAVDQYQQHLQQLHQAEGADAALLQPPPPPSSVVYVEPGCHFFTYCGVDMATDVLVQRGFERSMDSIAAAGLNPIPVAWSEMEKLGISMRASVLLLKFLLPGAGGVGRGSGSSPLLTKPKRLGGRWQSHQIPSRRGVCGIACHINV
ncbi:hypothetical protein STCU_03741 [Strigomonas culicis]|uniref:RNA-editing substrate-binding complex 5 protein domain-containing protein n=1 Tax=Strigomonas culicis TaxID=28005 RepID=S9UJH2_9TRYP|nr:hypothetical protein STCU_03741 [Strigomonas culicis]|eukprot:EPY30962.1 hypothetical protein STCU_03741 [Strigomonas culicis]